MAEDQPPILARRGQSAAGASHPETELEDDRYHHYEGNPVPWWVAAIWLGFIAFAITYLIRSLMMD